MGYFFDYVTGGNPKVAAKSIYNVHSLTNGNFIESFTIRWNSLVSTLVNMPKLSKTVTIANKVLNKELKNYTDLALFSLSMEAAPQNTTYYETDKIFRPKIEKYLRELGIPEPFITGDNRNLIEANVTESLTLFEDLLKERFSIIPTYNSTNSSRKFDS